MVSATVHMFNYGITIQYGHATHNIVASIIVLEAIPTYYWQGNHTLIVMRCEPMWLLCVSIVPPSHYNPIPNSRLLHRPWPTNINNNTNTVREDHLPPYSSCVSCSVVITSVAWSSKGNRRHCFQMLDGSTREIGGISFNACSAISRP